MPPVTRRRGRGRFNPVPRNPPTSGQTSQTTTPVQQQIPVITQPVPTISAEQLKDVTDKVTDRVLAQLNGANANAQLPIFDSNNQGNAISNDTLDENVSVENFQVESIATELGYSVPNKIKMKIANGEYVDLATLISKPSDPDSLSKQLKIENGKIVLGPKSHDKKIDSIDQWTDAFLVYASIYSVANPSSANSLFKYMHTVRLGASRFGGLGWKNYDIQFRLKKETEPSLSWSTVDQELWLLFMHSKPESEKEAGTNQRTINNPSSNQLKCYNYNFKGFCSRMYCNFAHQCLRCSNFHPLKKCRVASNINSRSQQSSPNTVNSGQSGTSGRVQLSGKFRR